MFIYRTLRTITPTVLTSDLLRLLNILNISIGKGSKIFRARDSLTEEQWYEEGLWYPPIESQCKQGRFNCEGECMAYFSDSYETSKNEVTNEESTHYNGLECVVQENEMVFAYIRIFNMNIGEIRHNKLNDKIKNELKVIFHDFDSITQKKLLLVNNFFAEKMVQETNDYRYTNMIGHFIFDKYKFDGLIYPSVKSNYATNNILLPPKNADLYVKPAFSLEISLKSPGVSRFTMYK
ncbi:MAG: RES domain-containing protein [Bacteroidales bacterium]|nr:RES domain-containing protein [Bacteroidales bacterium]